MSTTVSSSAATPAELRRPPPYTFGVPWPELNDGLSYTDIIRSKHSDRTLIDFYSSEYKSSAPAQGWLQRISNGQISIDGQIVTDPDTVLRVGSEVVYHRLPWKEPHAPYLLHVLYEDDDMVAIKKAFWSASSSWGTFSAADCINTAAVGSIETKCFKLV